MALVAASLFVPTASARAARTDALDTWKIKKLDLPAQHVEYVPALDQLLVTVDGTHASLGNDLVEVDPETGTIGRSVYVGSNPSTFAVSDDGSTAYVGLGGANAIARVDLTTFSVTKTFSTGFDSYFGPLFVNELKIPPGRTDLVVASVIRKAGITPAHGGVFAFQDGVALPNHLPDHHGPQSLVFRDATTIYGLDPQSWSTDFHRIALDAEGLTDESYADFFDSEPAAIEAAGELLVSTDGALVDPSGPTDVRSFDAKGVVEATAGDDRVTFVTQDDRRDPITGNSSPTAYVEQFALSTGDAIGTREFPELRGANGLVATATGFAATASYKDIFGSRRIGVFLLGPDVTSDTVEIPSGPPGTIADLATRFVHLKPADMVFDPARHRLYATMPATAPMFANKLLAIDPSSGEVTDEIALPDTAPFRLALSEDSSTLYVGLTLTREIARIDVEQFQVTSRFGLLQGLPWDFASPGEIAIRPGSNNTIAVALFSTGNSHFGNALYIDGVRSPKTTGVYKGGTALAFADAETLYGVREPSLYRMKAAADGLTLVSTSTYVLPRGDVDFELHADRLWATNGRVLDPSSAEVVATLDNQIESDGGAVAFTPDGKSIYQHAGDKLFEYDAATYRLIAGRQLPWEAFDAARQPFLSTGPGFAAIVNDGIVLLGPYACRGREATMVATSGVTTGTSGDDVIVGSPYMSDVIDGGGGDDTICGFGGDDAITGGEGDDQLFGDAGADVITGGPGSDQLFGTGGDDTLVDDDGADTFDGGAGRDTVQLPAGTTPRAVSLDGAANDGAAGEGNNVLATNEVIIGSDGPDMLVGSSGNETLLGMGGNDRLYGGKGNDTLDGGAGSDDLAGMDGTDTVVLDGVDAPHFVDLDNVADDGLAGEKDNVRSTNEVVEGSPGADYIVGSGNAEHFLGGEGNDILLGGGGADQLVGGPGNDRLRGGDGNDTLRGDDGGDDIDGGPGRDAVYLGDDAAPRSVDLDDNADDGRVGERDNVRSNNEVIVGSPGPDVIVGTGSNQSLLGMGGADNLYGMAGDDWLNGGEGNDRLFAGVGSDSCMGGTGSDVGYSCEVFYT